MQKSKYMYLYATCMILNFFLHSFQEVHVFFTKLTMHACIQKKFHYHKRTNFCGHNISLVKFLRGLIFVGKVTVANSSWVQIFVGLMKISAFTVYCRYVKVASNDIRVGCVQEMEESVILCSSHSQQLWTPMYLGLAIDPCMVLLPIWCYVSYGRKKGLCSDIHIQTVM